MPWIRRAVSAIAGFAAVGLFALPAAAQTYDPLTVQDVQRVLEAKGMTVGKTDPSDGKGEGEYINASYDGVNFWVHFTACDDDGTSCEAIVFDAGFTYNDKSKRPSLAEVNEWNEFNLGKGGIDKDGNPWVNIEVNIVGGITRANLEDTTQWWENMLKDFTEAIRWTWPT